MALVPPIDARRYGGVTLGPGGDITGFVPRGPAAAGALHFTGVQAVSPDAFHSVPEGAVASTVGGLYEHLIATRPGSVRGWVTRASCPEVGTVSDYWRTSRMLAAADSDLLGRGRGTRIDPSAHLRRVILWDEVIIEAGCRLEDCIVTDGVRVRAGETHRRSILWRRGGANVVTSFDEANVPTEPPAPLPGRSQ
jgi:NDP-sugar pyrophosphorylase family protein